MAARFGNISFDCDDVLKLAAFCVRQRLAGPGRRRPPVLLGG